MNNLVDGTINGMDGSSPDGTRCRICLGVFGFIDDYRAASRTVDVLGHNASSPCTLCTFRRLPKNISLESRYGQNTSISATYSLFLRSARRHEILRNGSVSDQDCNYLSMINTDNITTETCPLLYLSQRLEEKR